VTDGSDWFVSFLEMSDNIQYFLIHSKILWGSTTWNPKAIVVTWIDLTEGSIKLKVVTLFLNIGLEVSEVVDGSSNFLSCLFPWTYRVYFDSNSLQSMEWGENFHIFYKVSCEN